MGTIIVLIGVLAAIGWADSAFRAAVHADVVEEVRKATGDRHPA